MKAARVRSVCVLVSLFALSKATAQQPRPVQTYYSVGVEVLRLQVEGTLEDGCILVQAAHARINDAGRSSAREKAIRFLGWTRDEVLASSGCEVGEGVDWEYLPLTEYCHEFEGLRIRQFVADQSVETRVSRASTTTDPTIFVTTDGHVGPLLLPSMDDVTTLALLTSMPQGALVPSLGESSVADMLAAGRANGLGSVLPQSNSAGGCGTVCFRCGLGLGLIVPTFTIGIAAGCNPGTAGGTLGASCYWTVVTGFALAGEVASECIDCDRCLHPPPPPPGGGSSGGCQQAGGCCSGGYHECCGNLCCSDTSPPGLCP